MPMVTPDQNILDVDVDFTSGASGASTTFPQQCSGLRKGGHVLIRGRPCKIVDMSTSKTGKHGHAKVALVGLDIFTGKKLEDMCPSTHNKDVPNVTRKEYEVVNFSRDGYFSMMCDDGTLRSDLALTNLCNPSEKEGVVAMLKEVEEGYDRVVQAMVLGAMGEEVVKDLKIVKA